MNSIDVNRHPIARCDLHHLIDSAFASSSFSKNACVSYDPSLVCLFNEVMLGPRRIGRNELASFKFVHTI